jgi:hypothetical protein
MCRLARYRNIVNSEHDLSLHELSGLDVLPALPDAKTQYLSQGYRHNNRILMVGNWEQSILVKAGLQRWEGGSKSLDVVYIYVPYLIRKTEK